MYKKGPAKYFLGQKVGGTLFSKLAPLVKVGLSPQLPERQIDLTSKLKIMG